MLLGVFIGRGGKKILIISGGDRRWNYDCQVLSKIKEIAYYRDEMEMERSNNESTEINMRHIQGLLKDLREEIKYKSVKVKILQR